MLNAPGRVPSKPGIRASASTTRCGSSISPLMSPPCFFLYLQPRRGGVVERPLDTARAVALAEGLDPERALRGQFHRRSEERRVGKECVRTCRSRWWPYHHKKKNKI